MASSEPQPRFGQSVKGLLSDKVGCCSGDVIALTRQVLKGSRSQELLGQAARNMVIQEDAILHSEDVVPAFIRMLPPDWPRSLSVSNALEWNNSRFLRERARRSVIGLP
ncbi:BLOC-1-related complex subunit 7 [Clarias magur]|uniref:BLOC-1-related complex subunit 7 n=1 Tax=Clarias magur TaxID=1594786 RepID=A0A8J4XHE0_CLAMG|nr:BLOC-1-related complex subunit 7 [Clarias magur]